MTTKLWILFLLRALLCSHLVQVSAQNTKRFASQLYKGSEGCPNHCSVVGPDPDNWSEPWVKRDRTGNWTSIPCTAPYVSDYLSYTAQERWAALDCSNAWDGAIRIWKEKRQTGNIRFTESLLDTFHVAQGSDCETLTELNNCEQTITCSDSEGTGPAGYLIMNSLIKLHEIHASFYQIIQDRLTSLSWNNGVFVNTFAPIPDPEDNELAFQILLDIVSMGAVFVGGPFFNRCKLN